MKTSNMMVIEELARAKYNALRLDKSTHNLLIEFIKECVHETVDDILTFDEFHDNIFHGDFLEAYNYFLNYELPDEFNTIENYMCSYSYDRWSPFPEPQIPRIFQFNNV